MNQLNNFIKIPPEDFTNQVFPILLEVFNYPGSLLQLFKQRLSFRIIDEHFGSIPNQALLDALKAIGLSEGYKGCYYTFMDHDRPPTFELWLQSEEKNQAVDCWYVPFDEMEKAKHIPCAFCQSFISPKGDWGVFLTRENFLVLGCTPDVGKKLQMFMPDIDKSIYRFLRLYDVFDEKLKARWDWLPVLIHHLYGRKYDELLQKYEFHSI